MTYGRTARNGPSTTTARRTHNLGSLGKGDTGGTNQAQTGTGTNPPIAYTDDLTTPPAYILTATQPAIVTGHIRA